MSRPTKKNRAQRTKMAEETMEILRNQHYTSSTAGIDVDIRELLLVAIQGTVTYDPMESAELVERMPVGRYVTTFEVALETTLTGCARHSQEPFTAALNFASAKHPGGGFLNGYLAQEEELATASGLFLCINQSRMYEANLENPDHGLYQHYLIFSPAVPVLRDDDELLLDVPYTVNVLTVPAVNVGVARNNGVDEALITQTMQDRMDRMLSVASSHNIRNLILGAWGCGVFGGDVEQVASMFSEALHVKYRHQFQKVIFCVLEAKTKEIFERHFTMSSPTKKNRTQRLKMAEETMEILRNQRYTSSTAGIDVDIRELLRVAIQGTVTYNPMESAELVERMPVGRYVTTFEVALEKTLTSCARHRQEPFTAALNFASAKNPGGGFLRGTLAQEEELAYASGLFVCINQSSMYKANRENLEHGLYQHYLIFSPDVPVLRDDDGLLLDVPYTVNVLTVPAVNVGVARNNGVDEALITQTMQDRMDRMLGVASSHNMRNLILGAWGCGVFGGDVEQVASMFSEALHVKYRHRFQKVIFCVLEAKTKEIFERYFMMSDDSSF